MTITGLTTNIEVISTGMPPTYNETIVVLSSPNIITDNFKWIVDLYKGEEGEPDYELLSTIVILPNPDGFGVIDFHRHIENHITTSFYPADIDRVSERVFDDGLKWSFKVREQFENPKWRYDGFDLSAGLVMFVTDNVGQSFRPHPFVTGDEVSVVQDPGFTHPEYNISATTLTYVNEYAVKTDVPAVAIRADEPGLITLLSGGTRTIVQDYSGSTTTIYSFNGALSFQDFRNWDSSDYLLSFTSPSSTKFLLDGPREFDVTLSDRVWVNSYMDSAPPQSFFIESDNGTYVVSQIYIPTGQHFINQNKIGPQDLLETNEVPFAITGSLPIVDANTTFLNVTPYDSYPGSPVGETITMNVKDDCSKYEPIRFFYLDKFGSYLPITFNKVSRKNVGNSRSNYKQNYGNYDSVAESWGYTTYDRGITTYDLISTETVTCTSDWMNEDQVSMVVDMLNSPSVYIQDENGEYIAITITTNSYEDKKTVNDKLLNYTISFTYAQMNGNQRG